MYFKKRHIFLFVLIVFVVGFLGAYTGLKLLQPNMATIPNIDIPFSKQDSGDLKDEVNTFKQAYELIEENYVEPIEEGQLLEGAIQGMLGTLEDPYSSYMNAEAMGRFNEQITSSFQGIGAEVSMVDGKVTIVAPIKDSPAEDAGLRPNDKILKVDDLSLDGMDLNEAVEHIRGKKGSEVILTVERKSVTKPFEVAVVRDEIPIETVHSDIKDVDGKKTGIIEISSFSETTATDFTEALNSLEEEGIKGLVIDVRGNPGGLLDSVEKIMDSFIPKDVPYVQTEDRNGKRQAFYSDLDEKKPYPINIITNEGSASASEILAVALKEVGYDVVGETSFGKGTVQQALPLGSENDGMIKLTFFKWLSPEGNWIHEKGVAPTVKQKQPDFYYANPIQVETAFQFDETGEQIENAQTMLNGIGYDTGREDGYFDEQTKSAVTKFQQDHDLEVTGKIDEQTAGAIETKVIDIIRSKEQDLQLEKALEVLYQ